MCTALCCTVCAHLNLLLRDPGCIITDSQDAPPPKSVSAKPAQQWCIVPFSRTSESADHDQIVHRITLGHMDAGPHDYLKDVALGTSIIAVSFKGM
jgi:hypothetical protein